MTKRPIKITVRLSQAEAARLNALASECGSKKEPLIRNLIMGVEIKPRPTEEQLRLIREISGIANNINQITRLANTVKSVSPTQVEELQRLCSEALTAVCAMRSTEKRPRWKQRQAMHWMPPKQKASCSRTHSTAALPRPARKCTRPNGAGARTKTGCRAITSSSPSGPER